MLRNTSKPIQKKEFSNGKALKNNSSLLIHEIYKCIDYVIIPKPNFSSREGITSRCRRFDLLHFPFLAQSDAAIIAVVVALVRYRWRSTDRDRRTMAPAASFKYTFVRATRLSRIKKC